jgi:colanic acid biosynthesis glycosyl transferase WcaI
VLLVHDVYPDALVAAGMLRRDSLPVRMLGAVNRQLLRSMDAICVLGRDMAALLGPRAPRVAVHVTPNWAGDDVLDAAPEAVNPLRQSLGLCDKFVVQYAGNIGGVQDIDILVQAAVRLRDAAPDVHFLFIGSGRKKRWLQEAVRTQALGNVTIVDERPRTEQSTFLRACDVAVMTFVPGMWGVGVPSRLYNMLASGRPVIAAVDVRSEPALVIAEENAGWVVARASADTVKQMGQRAAAAAKNHYQRDEILRKYTAILAPFGLRRSTSAL